MEEVTTLDLKEYNISGRLLDLVMAADLVPMMTEIGYVDRLVGEKIKTARSSGKIAHANVELINGYPRPVILSAKGWRENEIGQVSGVWLVCWKHTAERIDGGGVQPLTLHEAVLQLRAIQATTMAAWSSSMPS